MIPRSAVGAEQTFTAVVTTASTELWNALFIETPADIETYPVVYPLKLEDYVFTASRDGHVALIAYLSSPSYKDEDFFRADDHARSKGIALNGMHAWRKVSGLYTQIDVMLPKPAGCPFQMYALLVFVTADAEAETMAQSLRPKQPFPCMSLTS